MKSLTHFRELSKLGTLLFCCLAMVLFALALAIPVQASDATDYTVTVSAGVNPPIIYTTQSASGSATASIVGNNPGASQELTTYSPTITFSIASVKGTNVNDRLPSATIHSDGTNLNVTAGDGTTPDTFKVTIQATYTWTDSSGTIHSPFGTTAVYVTVLLPSVTITLGDHVQIGHSISGTVVLSNPKSLPGSITVGLSALDVPPPNPQTNPAPPPATGMVIPSSSVTVTGDGSSANFTVMGSAVSTFLNDVYVKASSGATSNNANLTVWNIGPATCITTAEYSYDIVNDVEKGNTLSNLRPEGPAVDLQATAGITPNKAPLAWLSAAYPNAQIGLVQNVNSGTVYTAIYGNPQVSWNANIPKGTFGYSWASYSDVSTLPACVDTLYPGFPYPMPYDFLQPIASIWESSDGPSAKYLYWGFTALVDANGKGIGWVVYNLTSITITGGFADWCCIINGTTTFPATDGWSINVGGPPPSSSTGTQQLGQTITIGGGGGNPITSGTTANGYLQNPPVTPPPTRMSFTK